MAGCESAPLTPTPIRFEPSDLTSSWADPSFRVTVESMASESYSQTIPQSIYVHFPGEDPESLAALVSSKKLELTIDDQSTNFTHYISTLPSMNTEGWISVWLEKASESHSAYGTTLPNGRTGVRFTAMSTPVISEVTLVRKPNQSQDRLEARISEPLETASADALDVKVGSTPCEFMPEYSGPSNVSYLCPRADAGDELSFGPRAEARSETGLALTWFEGGIEPRSLIIGSKDKQVGQIYPEASD